MNNFSSEHEKKQPANDGIIDLEPYFISIWKRKYWGALIVVILFAIGFAASFVKPVMYTAEMTTAYESSRDSSSPFGGKLGALGSSLGLGGAGSQQQEDLAVLRSNRFTLNFIKAQSLEKDLIATSWHIFDQEMRINPKVYDEKLQTFSPGGEKKLKSYAHVRAFLGRIDISDDRRSTLITLKLSWPDAERARYLLGEYVKAINQYLRENEIEEAKRNIDFLTQQIATTDIVELKKTSFTLIEAQQKKIMLANTRPDYVLRIVDPPLKPFKKSKPSRTIFALAGGVLGAMLYFGWAITAVIWEKKATRRAG